MIAFQLRITVEYPNLVCSTCEANLSRCAFFAQQMKHSADNWEIFLKSDPKGYFQSNPALQQVQQIKIEFYDESNENVQDADTNMYEALEPPSVKVEPNDCDESYDDFPVDRIADTYIIDELEPTSVKVELIGDSDSQGSLASEVKFEAAKVSLTP